VRQACATQPKIVVAAYDSNGAVIEPSRALTSTGGLKSFSATVPTDDNQRPCIRFIKSVASVPLDFAVGQQRSMDGVLSLLKLQLVTMPTMPHLSWSFVPYARFMSTG